MSGAHTDVAKRIQEATDRPPITVTCNRCFQDYVVTYRGSERVAATHLCTQQRPPAKDTVLVL